MTVISSLAFALILQQSPSPTTKIATVTPSEFFVAISKRGNFGVLADIDNSPRFEAFLIDMPLEIALSAAAQRLGRFRMFRNGVQIFRRYPSNWDASLRSSSGRLVTWAMNLSETQVQDAANFGLDFQSLTDHEKGQFLKDMPISDELAQRMKEKPNEIRIGLAFTPAFEYKHPKTGSTIRSTISPPMVQAKLGAGVTGKAAEPVAMQKEAERTLAGPVWHAEGKTLLLKDLMGTVEATFKTKYAYDERFGNTKVFAIGQFDQELFEQSIKEIASADAPSKSQSRDEIVARQLKMAFDGQLSVLGQEQKWKFTLGELMSRSTTSAGDLMARNPALKFQFDRSGATPETQVRFAPALTIYLDVAGQRVGLLIREKGTP